MPDDTQEFGEGIPVDSGAPAQVSEPSFDPPEFDTSKYLLEELGKHGIDTTGIDPSTIVPTFAEGLSSLRKLPELEERARRAEEYERRLWAIEQERQQSSQQPQEPPAEKKKWSPPSLSDQTQRLMDAGVVSLDPRSGLYQAEDPRFASFVDEANKWRQWQADAGRKFWQNPVDFLSEAGLADHLQQIRQEAAVDAVQYVFATLQEQQAQQQRQQAQGALAQFAEQNARLFFKHDEQGRLLKDPQGREIMLPVGQMFSQYVREARGINPQADEIALVRYAWGRLAERAQSLRQPGEEESPAEEKAGRRERFSDAVTASRGGTVRSSEGNGTQQSEDVSFEELAKRNARKAGYRIQ